MCGHYLVEPTACTPASGREKGQVENQVGWCASGGQIYVTPDFAAFRDPETAAWLDKYYSIDEDWQSEDRRRLLDVARIAAVRCR